MNPEVAIVRKYADLAAMAMDDIPVSDRTRGKIREALQEHTLEEILQALEWANVAPYYSKREKFTLNYLLTIGVLDQIVFQSKQYKARQFQWKAPALQHDSWMN